MTKVSENGVEKASYEYDELNQLVRENNKYLNKTFFYTYDKGGNLIRTDWTYYSTLDQVPFMTLNTYHYGDTNWKDKLTSFNDQTITYDEIGNPLTYRDGWNFTWENGRKLATAEKSGYTVSYEYNADGLRTEKTVNGETTKYYYKGSQLLGEERDGTTLYYYYDSTGQLIGLNYNGVNYYALRNLQGDVVALTDKNGTKVVSYVYDSWGRVISVTGSLKDTLGKDNPFRYRGYYYDEETGFYYLQSRYYDPETCRFLNADGLLDNGSGMHGLNLYIYCNNNPVNLVDPSGQSALDSLLVLAGALAGASVGALSASTSSAQKGAYAGTATALSATNKKSYSTPDDAARGFAEENYSASRYIRHEYGAVIYSASSGGKTTYHYTPVVVGTPHNVDYGGIVNLPTAIATVHTHPNNNYFSPSDMRNSESRRMDNYMVGPNLKINVYHFDSRTTNILGVITPNPLSERDKKELVGEFQILWDQHVQSCPAGCKSVEWPTP